MFGLFEECVTITPYSHVAMLVRDPDTNRLFVWESSNADDLVDHISGRRKDGPRLVDAHAKIDEYLERYGTGIVYRRLIKPPTSRVFSREQWPALRAFMVRESPKHFERYPWQMAESWTHRTLEPRGEDLSSVFCSEEVANTWIRAGVPLARQPDMYCPQDFSHMDEDLFDRAGQPVRTRGWGLSQPFNLVVDPIHSLYTHPTVLH